MKPRRLRDADYLAFIRRLPCAVCEPGVVLDPWAHLSPVKKQSDPDHLPMEGMKGIGTKVPDVFVVPLCRECHQIRERHFSRPWAIYDGPSVIDRGLPPRWARVNLFAVGWRIYSAYHNPPEWVVVDDKGGGGEVATAI